MRARFSAPVMTGSGAHPASCTMRTRSFPGVKSDRSVTLTPHPLLVQWSRKGRAKPLLPLWAIRPVQSFSGCTRVHFYISIQSTYICSTHTHTYNTNTCIHACGYTQGIHNIHAYTHIHTHTHTHTHTYTHTHTHTNTHTHTHTHI